MKSIVKRAVTSREKVTNTQINLRQWWEKLIYLIIVCTFLTSCQEPTQIQISNNCVVEEIDDDDDDKLYWRGVTPPKVEQPDIGYDKMSEIVFILFCNDKCFIRNDSIFCYIYTLDREHETKKYDGRSELYKITEPLLNSDMGKKSNMQKELDKIRSNIQKPLLNSDIRKESDIQKKLVGKPLTEYRKFVNKYFKIDGNSVMIVKEEIPYLEKGQRFPISECGKEALGLRESTHEYQRTTGRPPIITLPATINSIDTDLQSAPLQKHEDMEIIE